LQDTGGFFIAVITKTTSMPSPPRRKYGSETEGQAEQKEDTTSKEATAQKSSSDESDKAKEKEQILPLEETKDHDDMPTITGAKCPKSGSKKKFGELQRKEEPFLPLSDYLMSVWEQVKYVGSLLSWRYTQHTYDTTTGTFLE
jgi:hypothetical protein